MFPTIIIVVFAIVIAIASSAAQVKAKKGKPQPLQQKAKMPSRDNTQANAGRPARANAGRPRSAAKKDTRTYRALEDRENDWLARQRREEAASERRFSAMYGLKRSHEANCDARRLIIEHYNECDADGIDTGMA